VVLSLLDGDNALLRAASDDGRFDVPALAVEPWSPASPKRYRLQLELKRGTDILDEIQREIGFRNVRIERGRLLINGDAVQLKGFGLHEDFPVLGKGQALAVTVKDLELLRWCGGNSLRTSHYPYSEASLDLADALGLLVIGECASVNLDFRRTTDATLEQHIAHLERLIARDHWHPSVIAWSLTNEPGYLAEAEYQHAAPGYFAELFAAARVLDATRPLTAANVGSRHGLIDPLYRHCDFLSLNRYLGWYEHPAQLDLAIARLREEFDALSAAFPDKPIFVSEFGADAVAGMHSSSDQLFSEEYQAEFLARYWQLIASHPHCIGGHIWNLIDFKTAQNFRRVVLNHKGVFTRQRDPKMAAWRIREMWR
jgi:beta-glucuronidase